MINKIKKSTIVLIIIQLLFITCLINISNAAGASVKAGKSTLTVGESTTISASVTGSPLDFSAKVTLNGKTVIDLSNNASGSYSFKPTAPGTYTFKLSGEAAVSETEIQNLSGSCTVTVKEKETPTPPPSEGNSGSSTNSGTGSNSGSSTNSGSSSGSSNSGSTTKPDTNKNNNDNKPKNTTKTEENTVKSDNYFLASLSVNQGKLSPEFEKGTKDYNIIFDEGFDFTTLTNIEITAKAEDSKASVILPSDTSVRDGENTYLVTVNAEDSTSITYSLKLIKPEKLIDSGLKLKSLSFEKIDGNGESTSLEFSPEFNPEVKEYKANVTEDIERIEVNAKAEENVTVEIEGGEKLEDGENNIYIYLKNATEDTNSTEEASATVYKIVINKKAKASEGKKKMVMSKTVLYIVLGIVGVLILLLVCLIVVNKKIKKANEDFEEFVEEEKTEKEENIEELKENVEESIEEKQQDIDSKETNEDEPQDEKDKE